MSETRLVDTIKALCVLNDVASTPHSVNYKILRRNACFCRELSVKCREYLESPVWKAWIAKVENDTNTLLPAAIDNFDSYTVKALFAAHYDDTFIQVKMFAKLVEMFKQPCPYDLEYFNKTDEFRSSLIYTDDVDGRKVLPDMLEVACRVVLVASASDLKLTRSYDDVVFFISQSVDRKANKERGDYNFILWQSQIIDVCTHILCLVFSDEVYVPEAYAFPFPKVWCKVLVYNAKRILLRVLQQIVHDKYTGWPTEYTEKLEGLLASKFANISMAVRLCMSVRNNQGGDYEETNKLMGEYARLLTQVRGNNRRSTCVLADMSICISSLEKTAIENIEVCESSSPTDPANDRILRYNRLFLHRMYQYRKKSELDHIKLAEVDFADSFDWDHTICPFRELVVMKRDMMELTAYYARHMSMDS